MCCNIKLDKIKELTLLIENEIDLLTDISEVRMSLVEKALGNVLVLMRCSRMISGDGE